MAEKIVIDAGHDGLTDPGAVHNGRRESDDALRLAMAVGEILAANGYDVDYTRTGDVRQSASQKAQLANGAGAGLFVSLHRNHASYPGQYDGVQTLVYDKTGLKDRMAENINANLSGIGFTDLGVEERPDLAVLRRTDMPALLVEAGFIDNDKDNRLFDSRFNEIAKAVADGIMDTLNARDAEPEPGPVRNWALFRTEPPKAGTADPCPGCILPAPPENEPENPSRPLYRVQVGAFYNLQNAVNMEQELRRLGYNTWIVTAQAY